MTTNHTASGDEESSKNDKPREIPFQMVIEDIFEVKGRGIVAVGKLETGILRSGDDIEIVGEGKSIACVVAGLDVFHHPVLGQRIVGIHIRNLRKQDVAIGMSIVTKQDLVT